MTNEPAALRRRTLTFLSRFSSLLLVVAAIGLGCSTTDPNESGAGGAGGATAGSGGTGSPTAGSGGTFSGGGGNAGGPVCARSPMELPFGCATTYDQQLSTNCGNAIVSYARAGQCGSGWAWSCGGLSSRNCFYDGQKNLVRGSFCDDVPTPYCAGCSCDHPNCVDSRALSTDIALTCNLGQLPPVNGAGGATGS